MTVVTDMESPRFAAFSQAVVGGGLLYTSGVVSCEVSSGKVVVLDSNDIELQMKRVMRTLKGILGAAEMSFKNVIKTTIYYTRLGDYARINEFYLKALDGAGVLEYRRPARTAVPVTALALEGLVVEIEMIAEVPKGLLEGKTE